MCQWRFLQEGTHTYTEAEELLSFITDHKVGSTVVIVMYRLWFAYYTLQLFVLLQFLQQCRTSEEKKNKFASHCIRHNAFSHLQGRMVNNSTQQKYIPVTKFHYLSSLRHCEACIYHLVSLRALPAFSLSLLVLLLFSGILRHRTSRRIFVVAVCLCRHQLMESLYSALQNRRGIY